MLGSRYDSPDADGRRPGKLVANQRPTPIPSCPGRATIGAVRLFPRIGLGVSMTRDRARRALSFMAAEFDGRRESPTRRPPAGDREMQRCKDRRARVGWGRMTSEASDMTSLIGVGLWTATFAALFLTAVAARAAPAAGGPAQSFSLKAGQEVTVPITI